MSKFNANLSAKALIQVGLNGVKTKANIRASTRFLTIVA
jgi:hypothetical protein